jgi:hypothetical protein
MQSERSVKKYCFLPELTPFRRCQFEDITFARGWRGFRQIISFDQAAGRRVFSKGGRPLLCK